MKYKGTDERIVAEGRTLKQGDIRFLGWSLSSVSFKFTGTRAKAKLKSDATDHDDHIYARVAVYINNADEPSKVVMLTENETELSLFESKEKQTVTVKLVKYSEAAFAYCGVESIETDGELEALPKDERKRIEFIGDSITCGYGIEAENELINFRTDTENPAKAYAALAAKALDLRANYFCWSGNGTISKYVGEDATEPLTGDLMPELYEYTDLSLSKRLYPDEPEKWEKWDFSAFAPELIVVNLGTNDCSWCKDIAERKLEYKQEFLKFLKNIRRCNPGSKIAVTFGIMDKRLNDEEAAAVAEAGDSGLFYIELPQQDTADGLGADYHPSAITHKKMAALLSEKLKNL